MTDLVRELSDAGVQVNVTALMTLRRCERIAAALRRRRAEHTSRCSPGASPTPGATRCR